MTTDTPTPDNCTRCGHPRGEHVPGGCEVGISIGRMCGCTADPAAELERRIRLRLLTEGNLSGQGIANFPVGYAGSDSEPYWSPDDILDDRILCSDGTDFYGDAITIDVDEAARIAAREATATHDQDPERWGVVEAPDAR